MGRFDKLKKPLRLFTPGDKIDWSSTVQTEGELQLLKDVASRNGMAFGINEEAGKVFLGRSRQTTPLSSKTDITDRVRPYVFAQKDDDTCGLASCAMAINSIKGTRHDDLGLRSIYGYSLKAALDANCPGRYKDCGDLAPGSHLWEGVIRPSLAYNTPVVIGLNTPFSSTGRGHIVLITALLGEDQVVYADPADGKIKTTTRQAMEDCQTHPNGKFVFAWRAS